MSTDATLLDTLHPDSRTTLQRYGFDRDTFLDLVARYRERGLDGASNAVQGTVEPPDEGVLDRLAGPEDPRHQALRARGLEALAADQMAAVVLNGGMATRFGGVVKGVVEALPGRSFLQLVAAKLRRFAREAGGQVPPLLLMNSFATEEATRAHLAETDHLGLDPDEVFLFDQFVYPRLAEDGTLFRGDDGRASLYGPGHGDVVDAMRTSGAVDWLAARGVRHVAVYNVDNLGAGPDPLVLGHHLAGGRTATVELVQKAPGDKGGAPARVDGHLEIVEDFRFPDGFDQDSIGVFNTNTFVFDLEVLQRSYPLDWFTVRKDVGGRPAIQFEHLVGQVTAFLDAHYLVVPRDGVWSRFLPVKKPVDLEALQPLLSEIFDG